MARHIICTRTSESIVAVNQRITLVGLCLDANIEIKLAKVNSVLPCCQIPSFEFRVRPSLAVIYSSSGEVLIVLIPFSHASSRISDFSAYSRGLPFRRFPARTCPTDREKTWNQSVRRATERKSSMESFGRAGPPEKSVPKWSGYGSVALTLHLVGTILQTLLIGLCRQRSARQVLDED